MSTKPYCSKCKVTDVPLIKYAFVKGKQYYHCRDCNAKKHRDYRKTERGPQVIYDINLRQQAKYPERVEARKLVRLAISRGDIHKSNRCEDCGAVGPTEGHHEDYSKPLNIVWLCKACHDKRK